MHYKRKLMACTAILGVWPLVLSTAGAQSASEAAKIERLERQTELLQRQLRELQQEIAQTRRKTERAEAKVEAAPARSPAAPPAGAVVTSANSAPAGKGEDNGGRLVSLIGHPWEGLDVYAYGGIVGIEVELLQRRQYAVRPGQPGLQQCDVLGHDAVLVCRRHAPRLHRQQL